MSWRFNFLFSELCASFQTFDYKACCELVFQNAHYLHSGRTFEVYARFVRSISEKVSGLGPTFTCSRIEPMKRLCILSGVGIAACLHSYFNFMHNFRVNELNIILQMLAVFYFLAV